MTITHNTVWQGVKLLHTWQPSTELSTSFPVRQISSVCFSGPGEIVLVSETGNEWNLPGGHPEAGETPTETLTREVAEEACAEVLACRLIGWQRVDDPREPAYLQLRYVVQVHLHDFQPVHEIRHRRLVSPQDFLSTLSWGRSPIAAELLRVALEANLP
ncbi:NUDIX hydrolase [Deinococcus sp. UYEF24]